MLSKVWISFLFDIVVVPLLLLKQGSHHRQKTSLSKWTLLFSTYKYKYLCLECDLALPFSGIRIFEQKKTAKNDLFLYS